MESTGRPAVAPHDVLRNIHGKLVGGERERAHHPPGALDGKYARVLQWLEVGQDEFGDVPREPPQKHICDVEAEPLVPKRERQSVNSPIKVL